MTLRLALCQVDATVGDVDGNTTLVRRWLGRARDAGADVVAFPELVLAGYPPEDLVLRSDFGRACDEAVRSLVPDTDGLVAVVGFVQAEDEPANAAAVLADGRLAGVYRKQHLPNYGVFDEFRYFRPGEGVPLWRLGDSVLAVNICEDIWHPTGPTGRQVIEGGAHVVVNMSASPYHVGKGLIRERMIATRAFDHACYVAFVNMVGGQDELVFDGHSLVAGPDGEIIARGAQFAEDLIVVDLDVERVRHLRRRTPKARLLGTGAEAECEPPAPVEIVDLEAIEPKKREPLATAACRVAMERDGEVYAALVLGLRDYAAKSGFKTVALGLSGGVDSALTAAIAVDALGSAQVVGVVMPSDYSSPMSAEDALALCDALEIRSVTLPISGLQGAYRDALAEAFQGTAPGIAEENVQARIRGNLIMALANKFGWLVLATGNKSELSVGYATLYGDMAGGFGVLKDVLKTSVYELARWRNAFPAVLPGVGEDDGGAGPSLAEWLLGPKGPVIPIRSIERAPSAELRPGQLDTDSLPPYETLDPILVAYVEEDRSIDEIVKMGHDAEVVARVAKMVDGAEYKRRQGPVGVRITTRAFGKDRRMPIANRWLG